MKKQDKIINFFKLVGLYDEKIFNYINKNKEYIEANDIEELFKIELKTKNNKLKSFKIKLPYITNNKTLLINIYLYAKGIYYYNRLNKELHYENIREILPVTLVRIYAELYLDKKICKKLNEYEEEKAINTFEQDLLLAYDLQFNNCIDYMNNDILLVPDTFYIDDVENLKDSCLVNLKYYNE